jgi:mono/diheme cytochrome c family protein
VLFIGGARDRLFRAYETKTGKELWSIETEQLANANPITYMGKDGNQYVAVVAGTSLLSYALSSARPELVTSTSNQETTIWDGVYSDDQARRGQRVYQQACAQCHLQDLSGAATAPALIGQPFFNRWNNLSLGDMVSVIRATMPEDAPDSLSPAEYIDLSAYLLQKTTAPSGEIELPTEMDDLFNIIITEGDQQGANTPHVDI